MSRAPTDAEWNTLHSWFPNLSRSSVFVLGGATTVYNCLAWALGYTDRWVWPWGSSKPALSTFNSWLSNRGYTVGTPAAAASYGPTGSVGHIGRFWVSSPTSKLGNYLLITHPWSGIAGGAYGGIRQYYRRTTALAEETRALFEAIEVPEQARELSPLSTDEASRLERLRGAVKAADRRAFERAYQAWARTLADPRIALDSTGAQATFSPEFARVTRAAQAAIPDLLEKLLDGRNPQAMAIAQAVLPPELVAHFEPDDPMVLEGEQMRARLTVANVLSSD